MNGRSGRCGTCCAWSVADESYGRGDRAFHCADALGGVNVCLTTAVDDAKSHLKLSAGPHLLTGDQALAFARVRHGIGDEPFVAFEFESTSAETYATS